MRRLACLASMLAMVASCGRAKEVHVTILAGSDVTSDMISTIRSLDIAVLGDEPNGVRYGISGELDDRKTTWVYRSKIDGQLEFELVARDVNSNVVASGKSNVVKTGGSPVSTTITLATTPPNPNKDRLGERCTAGVDTCASGFCVDGVCCNTACTGACNTCDGLRPGTCGPATTGTNPRGMCTADATNVCGLDGTCDGAGACRKGPVGKVCAEAACKSGTFTPTSECDGMGTCVTATPFDCTPYSCNTTGTGCATVCSCGSGTACTGSADCAMGVTCTNGSCGQVALGGRCATTADCTMGTCVDTVCCEVATCGGSCQSCNEPGHEGHCTSTTENSDDPHGTCMDQGATSCGMTGKCDGNGACQKYTKGTPCAANACSTDGTSFLAASVCAGDGTSCPKRAVTECAPYTCDTSDGPPGCSVSCGDCVFYEANASPPFSTSCATGKTCTNDCLAMAAAWTCQ